MKTLEIHVPEDVAAKIERAAEHEGVSLEEWIHASIEQKLARDDDRFERAALATYPPAATPHFPRF